MAVILEVIHPSGDRTRHAIGALPLSLGRGLSNDLVLDDPYVDARHARIVLDDFGVLQVEDLGSVNGLVVSEGRVRGRTVVRPGGEIRVGRTTLRFRDADEPVPPALVDSLTAPAAQPAAVADAPARVAAPAVARRPPTAVERWATSQTGRLTIAAAAMCAFGVYMWLGSTTRSSGSDVIGSMLAFGFLAALWAGIWAVASRVTVQRFHFVGHLAVASSIAIAGLAVTVASDWLSFFFPDVTIGKTLSVVISALLLATLVAAHLSLASTLARRARWRAGFIAAGTILAIGAIGALADDEPFSDVPSFSSVVKPVAPQWVPTTSVADFGAQMQQLKDQVDRMAKK